MATPTVENATIAELQAALAAGDISSAELVRAYLARIAAYDRAGPRLNSVREVNPDAVALATALDATPARQHRALEGIPILLKDNIATGDAQHTTAGSLALADARARRDAAVAALLRAAGAVILGKANLTEFANILAIDMPSGYSSLSGQVRNPYAPELDDKGVPIVPPGGSSSGSAVAVAAGLAAAAIGTETSGSLLSPASQNGLVTVKPTVGLISRAGIVPIAHSQDTAGPLTRTVEDAAILLNVLAAADPADPATAGLRRAEEIVGEIDPGHVAIKREPPVNVSQIAFVDLQIAEFAAELQGVPADHLRKAVGRHVGVVGLEGVQGGYANDEAVERDLRHVLRISGRAIRNNPEGTGTGNESQRGKLREAAFRGVLVDCGAEEGHPCLIYSRGSKSLGVAHHELLRPGRRKRGETCHGWADWKRVEIRRIVKVVVP